MKIPKIGKDVKVKSIKKGKNGHDIVTGENPSHHFVQYLKKGKHKGTILHSKTAKYIKDWIVWDKNYKTIGMSKTKEGALRKLRLQL